MVFLYLELIITQHPSVATICLAFLDPEAKGKSVTLIPPLPNVFISYLSWTSWDTFDFFKCSMKTLSILITVLVPLRLVSRPSQPSCAVTASLSLYVTQALFWALEVIMRCAWPACSAVEHLKARKGVSCHLHSELLVFSQRSPQTNLNSLFYTVVLWLGVAISFQLIICSRLDAVPAPQMTWVDLLVTLNMILYFSSFH